MVKKQTKAKKPRGAMEFDDASRNKLWIRIFGLWQEVKEALDNDHLPRVAAVALSDGRKCQSCVRAWAWRILRSRQPQDKK